MEKRKIHDIIKRVVIFVLGVSTLVGSFFLGAYWERSHVNSISAAADNGMYKTYLDEYTPVVSDLYPYDYISVEIGAPNATPLTTMFSTRYVMSDIHTYTVKAQNLSSAGNTPVYIVPEQSFPFTTHFCEFNYSSGTTEVYSQSSTVDIQEDPNMILEIDRNSPFVFGDLTNTEHVAVPFRFSTSWNFATIAYSISLGISYSDIVLPAYRSQGSLTSYGLPSFGFYTARDYIGSHYWYSGIYRTDEDSTSYSLDITGPGMDEISADSNRINFIYDLLAYLNKLHPNAKAYWFENLSYRICSVPVATPPYNQTFRFNYSSVLANTEFNLKNVSRLIDVFNLVRDETVIVPGGDLAPTDWLGNTIKGVFDVEIFNGMSLGGLFLTIIAVPVVIWILKLFAGG